MAALKEPVKMFIVQSLACFETPQQVADSVEEIYKIKIDRKQCHSYDPTKYAGRNLSKKLKDLFERTRKDFRENVEDIAIANKAFRLMELQKMYEDSGKNKRTKQNLLKQAFQETDGRVTKQEITGKDGKGRLMNSYTHNVLVNGVEVGTDVVYAPYLHFGATILPKNGQYITFAVGGQYRKVKQSVLPPRTQLGINAEDEAMVLDIVGSFIDEHLLRSA